MLIDITIRVDFAVIYPRFGFESASTYRLVSQWEGVPDAAFMVAVLDPGALPEKGGTALYRGEFDDAM
ncbi:hypothetical protein SAMN06295888_101315 [Desulfonatronum zhilinae]|nr:hypothetical protein SAMN06295888_101315 [Desulfonatronum zhilinae]